MKSGRSRLPSFLLVATLTVLVGCVMLVPYACAVLLNVESRQVNGATSGLGSTLVTPLGGNSASLLYTPAAGYYFVRWEVSSGAITLSNPNTNPTTATLTPGSQSYGVIVYYQKIGEAVGGVVLPTNGLTVLVPYMAVIGLVATAAIVVKRKRLSN